MLSGHQEAITSNLVQWRHGFDANSVIVVLRIATKNTQIFQCLLRNVLAEAMWPVKMCSSNPEDLLIRLIG